ncbi:unnamed protein product [Leptidea sinapis]|uniref:ACB domain-containing protein n=1 Tax=Leptidea sinapis TaxID=189913 RepID=A0A5E4Q1R1_9NEOP|nr:unnamed protein product [Leptidea sinapis]
MSRTGRLIKLPIMWRCLDLNKMVGRGSDGCSTMAGHVGGVHKIINDKYPKANLKMKVNTEKIPLETDQGIIESEERRWGLPLKEVYKHGLLFYKAYTQQTAHGPLDVNSVPPLGVLDVIGRDRRAAWQALGHMSQIQAMAGFIHTLDRIRG